MDTLNHHQLSQRFLELTSDGLSSSTAIKLATDIEVSEAEAQQHMEDILRLRETMAGMLRAPVDIRVAMLHYFTTLHPRLTSPRVVESSEYFAQQKLTYIDDLTQLNNRRYIRTALQREVTRSRRYTIPFALLFLDIDNFKSINDTYGHSVGDRVLRNLSATLRKCLREEDIPARFGGEEFLVLLPHTDAQGAAHLSMRMLNAVRRMPCPHGIHVTFSGGLAVFPDDATIADELLDVADALMYKAKQEGKNRICASQGNRRQVHRHTFEMPLIVYPQHGGPLPATGLDISAGGIGLRMNYHPADHEQLVVTFTISPAHKPMELSGVVCWYDTDDLVECGVRFLDDQATTQRILKDAQVLPEDLDTTSTQCYFDI